jgi:hypothetical protein
MVAHTPAAIPSFLTLAPRRPGGEGRVRGGHLKQFAALPTSPSPALWRRGPSLSPLKGGEGLEGLGLGFIFGRPLSVRRLDALGGHLGQDLLSYPVYEILHRLLVRRTEPVR